MSKPKLAKETIEQVLWLLDSYTDDVGNHCSICKYELNCDEHVECIEGIADYLYNHQGVISRISS